MGRDVWFALAIVLVLMLLGTADSPAQQDATYEEARRLFDAKEYRGAAGKFGEILETQPDYYWGWHSVGVCHWKLGELAEAERGLRRALELEPASFESSYVLGKVLYDGRAYEDSAVELERTVTLAGKPRQRDAASSALAESLFGAGKYEEARSVWEEQVAANGTAFRPRYMLGLTCRRLDDLACAVENLRWARDLKSGDSRLPRTVAELSAYRAAQTESGALGGEAVSDAQVWVRAAPKAPEARVHLAAALLRAGRFAEAAQISEDSVSRFPDECRLCLYAAKAHNGLGQSGLGRTWADQALECDPKSASALNQLARASLDEARSLIATGELMDARERIDPLLADVHDALTRSLDLEPGGAAERLRQEVAVVESAYRAELERQQTVADDIKTQADERRCDELRVKWWNSTHADGPPPSAEERTFLRETCSEDVK